MSIYDESLLEEAIIELFKDNGYTYTSGESIIRESKDILLKDDLKEFLHNQYTDLSEVETNNIVSKLDNMPSSPLYNSVRDIFLLINEGFDLIRDNIEKNPIHINYIDYDNPQKNIFRVVNQYEVEDIKTRRPDLLLFINGIPLGIFEFKSAIKEDATIYNAWEQITNRYTRDIPSLLKYCVFAVISDGVNNKLGTIFSDYEFFYSWNKVNDKETVANGIDSLLSMIKGAFTFDRILKIIQDFIYFPDNTDNEVEIICRYPQFFGAMKMLQNIKDHLHPTGDGKGGTYFGATGCGKTYTMLFLARMLMKRYSNVFSNPTIIIITDREDLDSQTSKIFANATNYLGDSNVRSIESRDDLGKTLGNIKSGGVYVITIQKFCEDIGLLSDRYNIICMSDEAHRTQGNLNGKIKLTETDVRKSYGFAKYLRDSFPNATYTGFTGTPLDETFNIFGDLVEKYSMKDACSDKITVPISYEPRMSKVLLNEEVAKAIEDYYKECEALGSNPEQIELSKKTMSKMREILGNPYRREKIATDLIAHYEKLCDEKPEVVQKAMIVCYDRQIAFDLMKELKKQKPEWFEEKLSYKDNLTDEEELKLKPMAKVNLVATQGKDDNNELYEACGNKSHRKLLEEQFKNDNSNFQIAIVVDMWITGFDVPSLAVMYIDKPLQRHTLIQTISRVNRIYKAKEKGLIVDYVGFEKEMIEAVKLYGSDEESPVTPIEETIKIFRNELQIVVDLMNGFDSSKFFGGTPFEMLNTLNKASEFVQIKKDRLNKFMNHTKKLRAAFNICNLSGELSDNDIKITQFFLAVRAIIVKETKGTAPDAETMNRYVAKMMEDAITATNVENVFEGETYDFYDPAFMEKLNDMKMPVTKYNALIKIIRRSISEYGKINKIKSIEFQERLQKIIDKYNNRDSFVGDVVNEFIDNLSGEVMTLLEELKDDENSFKAMGISAVEKAFYDILIKVRNDHGFEYEDYKCIELAKEIKNIVDDKIKYANFNTRNDIKSQLSFDLMQLLFMKGYPPQWNNEIFDKVLEQSVNYKNNN